MGEAFIHAYADVYDVLRGPIEHSFGEDHQGLPLGQRRPRAFVAQEMMLLLLASDQNTLVWSRGWGHRATHKYASSGFCAWFAM